MNRKRPPRERSALKPPKAVKRKKWFGPKRNTAHVILEDGLVSVIEGNCHQASCVRIDREHMDRQRATEQLRIRVFKRAGGIIGDRLIDGELVELRPATCECGCGRTASWEFGEMDEKTPRGGTGGGTRESGKMSYDNSWYLARFCHNQKHSGRAPRLKWVQPCHFCNDKGFVFRSVGNWDFAPCPVCNPDGMED